MILLTPFNRTLHWHVSLEVCWHLSLITNTLHIHISPISFTNWFYWHLFNTTLHWYVSLTCFTLGLYTWTYFTDTFHKHLSLRHIAENFQFKFSLGAYGQHNNIKKELKDSFIRYCSFNEEIFLLEISNLRHHFMLHIWIMVCNVIGLECT